QAKRSGIARRANAARGDARRKDHPCFHRESLAREHHDGAAQIAHQQQPCALARLRRLACSPGFSRCLAILSPCHYPQLMGTGVALAPALALALALALAPAL